MSQKETIVPAGSQRNALFDPVLRFARLLRIGIFLVAIMILGVFVQESRAQERFTISGTVQDAENGETLPHANIYLEGTSIGTATNVDGHFVLVGIPSGTYTLRVQYLGYQSARIEIDADMRSEPLKIRLNAATADLDEVVVTAEEYQIMKTAEDVSQITVSPRDLSVLPSLGEVDIFRSLQLLPGISGTNEGTSGLYVRGGTPDQNLVLLDGMTIYHVDHFFGFFSAFNADAIKDVQVYKSGFPAEYGGRTSSVVDLTGRTGGSDVGLGVGVNLLSTSMVAETPIGNRASLLFSARRSYTDVLQTGLYNGIFETVTGGDGSSDQNQGPGSFSGPSGGPGGALGGGFTGDNQIAVQPDFYFYDLNAKLNYRPTDSDVLALSVYNGRDNLDESRYTSSRISTGGQSGARTVNDVHDVTGWGNAGVSLKWSRQWTPRFYSNSLLSYSKYHSKSERTTLNERYAAEVDTLISSRSTSSLEDNNLGNLSVGLDNELQASKSHRIGLGIKAVWSNVRYENLRNDTLAVLDQSQQARQVAAYVQDTWSPVSPLRIVAGLRAATYDGTGDTYVEPRASFRLDLSNSVHIKGAYGRYNQFVARVINENVTEGARDFWLLADGETVGVQSSRHYVLGAAYETPGWVFDVEAYRKDIRGLSEFSLRFQRGGSDFEADELFFDGTGRARGIEFLIQRKANAYTGWLSYTLAQVEHTFDGLNEGEPFPALHDQPHELKLVGSARLGQRWNLSATWAFATGKPYTLPESQYTITLLDGTEQSYIHVGDKNGERLPSYHRLDAAVHYRFPAGAADVDVSLSLFNLYNRTNVWYKEFDMTESPFVTTDVTFLGLTPNLSVRVDL